MRVAAIVIISPVVLPDELLFGPSRGGVGARRRGLVTRNDVMRAAGAADGGSIVRPIITHIKIAVRGIARMKGQAQQSAFARGVHLAADIEEDTAVGRGQIGDDGDPAAALD